MPFAVEVLEAHNADFRVEEQIEFLHAHMENLCEREVSQFVNQHEKGQSQYQLNSLNHQIMYNLVIYHLPFAPRCVVRQRRSPHNPHKPVLR